ncbi:MAG: GHMP family kinase ATP-binding protein [Candidatus Kariarchaeaceae archaeon]
MIVSRAPSRIDFAGGTLDIFPLYLFHGTGITVNAAINLFSTVEITTRDDSRINLASVDLGISEQFNSLQELSHDLVLFTRAISFFKPDFGLDVSISTPIPKGSGLGTSSSLIIAMIGGLNHLLSTDYSKEQLVTISYGLETSTIQTPTGRQDNMAALYGGINALHFLTAWDEVEPLKLSNSFISELEKSMLLCFISPHFSGSSNWDMFKRRVEKEPNCISSLEAIKQTTLKMKNALLEEDLSLVAELLLEEWENRKKLSPTVCTPQMSEFISMADELSALSYKACGAGGGGSMVFMVEPETKKELEVRFKEMNGQILDFQFDFEGLTIREKK